MARDIYVNDVYVSQNKGSTESEMGKVVHLLAPESLEDDIYTAKSDVWAFGM